MVGSVVVDVVESVEDVVESVVDCVIAVVDSVVELACGDSVIVGTEGFLGALDVVADVVVIISLETGTWVKAFLYTLTIIFQLLCTFVTKVPLSSGSDSRYVMQ